MEILPKNITTKPGSVIAAPMKADTGPKKPLLDKQGFSTLGAGIEESRWPLVLGVFLFVLAALAWTGLFFYGKSLDKKITEADARQAELNDRMDKLSLSDILDLQKALAEARSLLAGHVYSSNALRLMEELTLPNVQWKSFALVENTGLITAKGRAQSYTTLAKQILILESDKDKRISKTSISGIGLDHEGGVSFDMTLTLDKGLFTKFPK